MRPVTGQPPYAIKFFQNTLDPGSCHGDHLATQEIGRHVHTAVPVYIQHSSMRIHVRLHQKLIGQMNAKVIM